MADSGPSDQETAVPSRKFSTNNDLPVPYGELKSSRSSFRIWIYYIGENNYQTNSILLHDSRVPLRNMHDSKPCDYSCVCNMASGSQYVRSDKKQSFS